MKLASYIAGLHGISNDSPPKQRRGKPTGPAVAVVFTKCDECPEAMEDPSAFAANNTSRLFGFCSRAFPLHAFFAASVAGSSGELADSAGRRMRGPVPHSAAGHR